MKRWISFMLVAIMFIAATSNMLVYAQTEENKTQSAQGLEIQGISGILMEATTGKVIYEKNADEVRPPASVTKVMTLLLIFEAIDSGKIKLEDPVTVSQHAASMGGSQVFLEQGEVQTVDTLIKCIAMASGNDASVVMAEHIGGSEEAFVGMMNERAKQLGMKNTNFANCCGLTIAGHVTTARDIAIMSRELTIKHPKIFDYTTVWMDEFTHVTKKGESVFGLANTNKLLKQYNGATGLKTGFTSDAKSCISATATRNGIDLIAVVMGAPDSKTRNKDVSAMLDYGFANVTPYEDKEIQPMLNPVPVKNGVQVSVDVVCEQPFRYMLLKGESAESMKRELEIPKDLAAPVKKDQVVGKVKYTLNGKEIGSIDIKAANDVESMTLGISFKRIFCKFLKS